ncbi:set domain-containing [Pyrenophora seminiperda CCB06]|uniref:Set domain-containing n=1 Tax=Pyrenophora seminiperda CCB06 TaxID=1302712 RepID=A0A3M7MCM2_9PLEO|nr:set domain-containing [Pyrenophora seminiperda CCB06]
MARGDSILTPITLDDDEPQPQQFRLPTVRRRDHPRIDDDGIEIQEQQSEWEQAAAQRARKRERGLRASRRPQTEASLRRDDGYPTERARERSPFTKVTGIIELIDEDEPVAHVPQQPALSEAKIPPREFGIPSSFDLQGSSTQGRSTNMESTTIQTAAPHPAPSSVYSRRQPTPSAPRTSAQMPEPIVIAQAPSARAESIAATHIMPRLHISYAGACVRDSESTLSTSGSAVPMEPTHTIEHIPLTALTEPSKPTSNNVVCDSVAPIGDFPDRNRERATSSRVNTSSERGGTMNKIDSGDAEPTKARKSRLLSSELLHTKGKAIKSVKRSNMGASKSRLQIRPPSQFLINEPFLAHVHDDHSLAPPRQHDSSQSRDPLVHTSNIANVKADPMKRQKNSLSTPEQLLGIVREKQVSDRVDNTSHPSPEPPAQRSTEAPVKVLPETSLSRNTRSAHNDMINDQIDLDDQVKLAVSGLAEDDLGAVRAAIDACLKRHIAERHETHAYLNCSKMMRQRTYQEQRMRSRNCKQDSLVRSSLPEKYVQEVSPFADMHAIQLPSKSSNTKHLPDMGQEIYVKAKPKDIIIKSGVVAPTTKYKSDTVTIPPFKEYVSLKSNILADNESKLLATPYFQDEDYTGQETLLSTLPYMYELIHDENGLLDLRKEQCRFYKETIEAFLSEIGVCWNDILYWLLAPESTITRINNTLPGSASFRAAVVERSRYQNEKFERDGQPKKAILFDQNDKKWRDFLLHLREPTAKALRIAATTCATILQECDFSIWYLAQRSEVMQDPIMKKTAKGQTATQFTYRHAMCRVCYQHNCLLHGELREVPEDSWKSDSEDEERLTHATDETSRRGSDDKSSRRRSQIHEDDDVDEEQSDDEQSDDGAPLPAHFHEDSDIEKVINYKLPVNADAFTICPDSEMIVSRGAKPPPGKFNSNWWLQQEITSHWEKRKPFFPCNHEGSCEIAECRCYREGINCEKTCTCSQSCNRRYPGCSCAKGLGKRVCVWATCLCVKFNRECDADLCGSCGASEVLDPVNRYDEALAKKSCGNVAIQRGVPRKTLLGHSEVHGFGLYMGEDIKSGEYIGEYTGEAISVNEGDRRVTIYDYQKTMYLFKLNLKQEVDATYMGNKMRFINNADDKYTNCCPKNLLCNTVFRVALYATTDIKAGTELYFNYNYPKEKTAQFKQPGGKVVAVKQTKQKTKRRESLVSLGQSIESRSRTLAATAKARAAKAAKRAARMQEEEATKSAGRLHSRPLQARKAVPDKPSQKNLTKPRDKTRNRSESTDSDVNMEGEVSGEEHAMVESRHSQMAGVVQDTDEEDDEFVLENTQEDRDGSLTTSEDEEVATKHVGDALLGRRSSRKRNGMSNTTRVVAVRKAKDKALLGAGEKKRKRPVIANSDDE